MIIHKKCLDIYDDELVLDIAMNAKYLDVRERAIQKSKMMIKKVILLKELLKMKKKFELTNEYILPNGKNKEDIEDILISKESWCKYKKIGNPKKEKFYNELTSFLKKFIFK